VCAAAVTVDTTDTNMVVDPSLDISAPPPIFEVEATPCAVFCRPHPIFSAVDIFVLTHGRYSLDDWSKFSRLILKKIIKTAATRCQILRLRCAKFDFGFGWGSAPDTAGGAHSAPQIF